MHHPVPLVYDTIELGEHLLLPEGNLRRQIAAAARVPINDTMTLLDQIGAECAGAVQILTGGAKPGAGQVRRLTKQEVNSLITDLPTYHLPEGTTPQASLAGIQDKVLLAALPDGAWGWPEAGAASTHIIKPEPLGGGRTKDARPRWVSVGVTGGCDV
jgi:serine/threonine-protein kinase HipA